MAGRERAVPDGHPLPGKLTTLELVARELGATADETRASAEELERRGLMQFIWLGTPWHPCTPVQFRLVRDDPAWMTRVLLAAMEEGRAERRKRQARGAKKRGPRCRK